MSDILVHENMKQIRGGKFTYTGMTNMVGKYSLCYQH
jgi:hypothetical protein